MRPFPRQNSAYSACNSERGQRCVFVIGLPWRVECESVGMPVHTRKPRLSAAAAPAEVLAKDHARGNRAHPRHSRRRVRASGNPQCGDHHFPSARVRGLFPCWFSTTAVRLPAKRAQQGRNRPDVAARYSPPRALWCWRPRGSVTGRPMATLTPKPPGPPCSGMQVEGNVHGGLRSGARHRGVRQNLALCRRQPSGGCRSIGRWFDHGIHCRASPRWIGCRNQTLLAEPAAYPDNNAGQSVPPAGRRKVLGQPCEAGQGADAVDVLAERQVLGRQMFPGRGTRPGWQAVARRTMWLSVHPARMATTA